MLTVNGIQFSDVPPEDRTVFALADRGRLSDLLVELKTRVRCHGAVLLSTCDRVELWQEDGNADGYEPLCRVFGTSPLRWKNVAYRREGDAAVTWLFELACGLHSPLFGEDAIISQLEDAAILSRNSGCATPVTQQLFRLAVTVGKKAHSLLDLDQCEPHLCTALADVIHPHEGLPVLVIGSSATGRMVASFLTEKGCRVRMTLRDERKTELVPPGVEPVSYDGRFSLLHSYSVVICATKGLEYALSQTAPMRENALVIDLANPHDVEDGLAGRNGVRLVRDADLSYRRENREKNIAQSNVMIQRTLGEFKAWLKRERETHSISSLAEAAAEDLVFRMHPVVGKLGIADETEFSHQLADTAYKSVIHQLFSHGLSEDVVDLSHPLVPTPALYPGDSAVDIQDSFLLERDGYRVKRITLGSHSLTHVDAPAHLLPQGKTLGRFPLSRFIGTAYVMDGMDVRSVPDGVDMVVVSTGWEGKWGTKAYLEGYPVLSDADVERLLARGIHLFAFDTPSPDVDASYPIHRRIFSADGLIVENLTGTRALVGQTVRLLVLPLPIDGDGAPARVIALR